VQSYKVNGPRGREEWHRRCTTLHGSRPVKGVQGLKTYPACTRAHGVQSSRPFTTLHRQPARVTP
jgi:hypothetical protein